MRSFKNVYSVIQPNLPIWGLRDIALFGEGMSFILLDKIPSYNIEKIYLNQLEQGLLQFEDFNVITIQKKSLLKIINRCAVNIDIDSVDFCNDNKEIFLITSYVISDVLSLDESVTFYRGVIDFIKSKGYSVVCKSHPRIDDEINKRLQKLYSNDKSVSFITNSRIPVEIMINRTKPVATVCSMSWAGLYCQFLFDIPTYGCGADIVLKHHKDETIRKMASFFMDNTKRLEKLL